MSNVLCSIELLIDETKPRSKQFTLGLLAVLAVLVVILSKTSLKTVSM